MRRCRPPNFPGRHHEIVRYQSSPALVLLSIGVGILFLLPQSPAYSSQVGPPSNSPIHNSSLRALTIPQSGAGTTLVVHSSEPSFTQAACLLGYSTHCAVSPATTQDNPELN